MAPFKSQNMALNSFITKEGLEMGRAQVMQAEAAGIEPSVLMNPILLKPTNDVGSQVIVNGEVLGTMSARDYFAYKKKLVPDIMKAFDVLAAENDIIVIEGAGSPAEINLKKEDIVNMGMAKMAKAPVLLVGDIDRGGVFAQLYGTVELLEEDERKMIKGLIINKFRGDKTILDPGVEMLESKCRIPVVGVAPYLNIQVEDEDSLTERFDRPQEVGMIDMAVIRVPRISNFTDFNPLESIPGVSLRYVQHPSDLKNPDVIFLPGTKNTMDDLKWLRESGMEALILKAAASGTLIFGVCGGYQMLGETLSDPHGVEAGGPCVEWDFCRWIPYLRRKRQGHRLPDVSFPWKAIMHRLKMSNLQDMRSIWREHLERGRLCQHLYEGYRDRKREERRYVLPQYLRYLCAWNLRQGRSCTRSRKSGGRQKGNRCIRDGGRGFWQHLRRHSMISWQQNCGNIWT